MDVSPRDLPLAAELPPTLVEELTLLLGERFTQSPGVCAHHGHDESHFPDRPPQAVAFVESREEIAALLRDTYGSKIKVFKTEISPSVKAKEASADGKSIYAHDPKGKVAEGYKNLTQEVMKLEKQREKSRAGLGR